MSDANKTALAILLPESEQLLQSFRLKYAPSAARGMPPHVTVLYPFKRANEINHSVEAELGEIISSYPSFEFSLTSIARFPSVLYLEPAPAEPFQKLTQGVASHYPETPPYEGKIANPIPHLTLAQSADRASLDRIANEFTRAADGNLPIYATAQRVWLLEYCQGQWQKRTSFNLG